MAANQVVMLTRCERTQGHPEMLAEMCDYLGCFFYPEYRVTELYRDFNLETYHARVFIPNNNPMEPPVMYADGFGSTVDRAVSHAAYVMITVLRKKCEVQLSTSPWRYIPAGFQNGIAPHYVATSDYDINNMPVWMLSRYVAQQDRINYVLRSELDFVRSQLFEAMTRVNYAVIRGVFTPQALDLQRHDEIRGFDVPQVEGHVPDRGYPVDFGDRPRSGTHSAQGPEAYRFPTPRVPLSSHQYRITPASQRARLMDE